MSELLSMKVTLLLKQCQMKESAESPMPGAQLIGMFAKTPESVDSNDAKHIEVDRTVHVGEAIVLSARESCFRRRCAESPVLVDAERVIIILRVV